MTNEILGLDTSVKNNAQLMLNVYNMGYLRGKVFDATYGGGGFWNVVRPDFLVSADLKPSGDMVADFTRTPFSDNTFDSVVLDGPYKLSGTPKLGEFDVRYGVEVPTKWQDRIALIKDGITESVRISRQYILVKCQDQVSSGHVRWQTREFADHGESVGAVLVDRFDLLGSRIPQPADRSQVHARRNTSTLLILEKK